MASSAAAQPESSRHLDAVASTRVDAAMKAEVQLAALRALLVNTHNRIAKEKT